MELTLLPWAAHFFLPVRILLAPAVTGVLLGWASFPEALPAAAANDAPFAALDSIVSQNPQLRSIDDFAPLLPQTYRDHFALVFDSMALPRPYTNAENPRAMLYGQGSLVVTFSGCGADATYSASQPYPQCETVEAMDYDASEKRFRFRAYHFPGPWAPPGAAVKVAIDPPECTRCHTPRARPLLDSSNFWSGFYGSIASVNQEVIAAGTPENAGYESFLAKHWVPQSGTPRKLDRYTSLSMDWSRWWSPEKTRAEGYRPAIHSKSPRPNSGLIQQLRNASFRHWAGLLWDRYGTTRKASLLVWWSRCFSAFDPNRGASWSTDFGIDAFRLPEHSRLPAYADFATQLEPWFKTQHQRGFERLQLHSADPLKLALSAEQAVLWNQATPMAVRLFELLGEEFGFFTMTTGHRRYDFSLDGPGLPLFQKLLSEESQRRAPELQALRCEQLIARYRSAGTPELTPEP
jgi:hypothetical protein